MQSNVTSLAGRCGIVFGVANKRSIAWAIAKAWHEAGARLAFTYQGERLKENVEELVSGFGPDTPMYPCDVTRDEDIARVFEQVGKDFGKLHVLLHSVAFAPKEALEGEFINTSREAFRVAHDVSAYSLVAMARGAAPLMTEGGSIDRDDVSWCGEGGSALQCDGRGQGVAGGECAVSRLRFGAEEDTRECDQRGAGEYVGGAGYFGVYADAEALRGALAAEEEPGAEGAG